MDAEVLPPLEEIYDLSSNDLNQLAKRLQQQLLRLPRTSNQHQQYTDFIESIAIQVEERKTLQFFQEICAVDNPYLKKVTEFNNQFLKLASEALSHQEQINNNKHFSPQGLKSVTQDPQEYYKHQNSPYDAGDYQSVISDHSRITHDTSVKQGKNHTTMSEKSTSENNQKKMGLNANKTKSKNQMKDFILNTLSKNKVQGCYVVKNGGQPTKPQPTFTVNERGHLVNAQTLQPNHKPKQIGSLKDTKTGSQKSVPQPVQRINQKEIEKRKQEAIQKIKGIKSESKKKDPKNSNLTKYLVNMVREQERQKQKKQRKEELRNVELGKQNESKIYLSSKKQAGKMIKEDQQCLTKQLEPPLRQAKDQIRQQIEEEMQIQKKSNSKQEQVQIKQEQVQIKQEINVGQEQERVKQNILSNQEQKLRIVKTSDTKARQKLIERKDIKSRNEKSSLSDPRQMNQIGCSQLEQQLRELASIKKELQKQKEMIIVKQQNFERLPSNFGKITVQQNTMQDETQTKQEKNEEIIQQVKKKCYNQEYWVHIREEAEFQIKRFKEEKQILQNSKAKIIHGIQKSFLEKPQSANHNLQETPIYHQDREEVIQQQTRETSPTEDNFLQKRKKQLKKMIKDHESRKQPKQSINSVPTIARTLHPLPNFNYLQVYPSFNHIFSVMYGKPQNQALADIPLIIKELSAMFSTHIQHFKEKGSYFQPAMFLPFDSLNNLQMSDPRQLLLHAENTYVNLKKLVERLQIFNGNLAGQFGSGESKYYRVVKTKQQVYDIISTGFLRRKGWKQLPHGCSLRASWNLFWSWSKPDIDVNRLLVWQRINHFPFNKNLSRKDLLYKNLDAFRKTIKVPFNFLPLTYNLPKQFTQFSIKFHEEQIINREANYWIMKPIGKSRGRGIKVINNLAELNYTDNIVVQKYIANPLLLDGYKFDMRIYVLVTNFHPLEAFLYREGFARLSTQKFSMEPAFIKNTFVHLTNFAVNRNNEEAKQTAAFSGGSKISLKSLKDKLTKMGYSFPSIWTQVQQIVVKSLLGCSVSVPPFPTAFELFGYDIMVDNQENCHLIEINASPSLQRSYLIDEVVKQSLIDDILDIVDPPDFDKTQLLDVFSQRANMKKKPTPEDDLIAIARILKYKPVRKIGQIPENMGLFEMIAPGKLSIDLQKLIKGRSGANNPHNID